MRINLLAVCILLLSFGSSAQISGTVFRDYNGNSVRENSATYSEPFVQGISVKVTLPGAVSFITTTNTSGVYNFSVAQVPAGTRARIEFYGLAAGDFSSSFGSGNGTNVQFAAAPSTTVNYAVNAPDDYWNNTAMPVPPLMLVNNRRGTVNSPYRGLYSILQMANNTTGPLNPANDMLVTADTSKRPAIHAQTGSLFGLAVQSKQERFFASAVLKRASGFGTQGPGGVYMITKSGAVWNFAGGFSLEGVTPSNGGVPLNFGSVTRVTSPATNDNYISDNYINSVPSGSDCRDMDAFSKATTISFGDIEADPNSDKIYMINLFQKRLIVFNASAATASLNGASAAALAPYTSAYTIPGLPGCPAPSGAGNNMRPFAVKIYKSKGYLGVVSDAMATQNLSDLKGYILQFDPSNIAAGFTTLLTIDFNNYRDISNNSSWRPWVTSWAQSGGTATTGPTFYPQPIITSIEFNENGSMDIGIRDRWGDQGATYEYIPVSGSANNVGTRARGDLLHACYTGTGWALEGTAGSCDQPAGNINANTTTNNFGIGNSYGNTGREWYADRPGDGDPESNQGGMTKLMGTGIIVSSVYDPISSGETVGSRYYSTHGVQWNTVATGAKEHIARIQGRNSNSMEKANGLGDLEFITLPQPIQVGNRIWLDADIDGIQDPEEAVAAVPGGTIIRLRSPGLDGIFGNADDQTWTTTTDANGNYFFRTLSTSDNRKPASWTGVGNIILPGYDYRIEMAIPGSRILSPADAGGIPNDHIDNDATANGINAIINFNAGNTNHNFDIGFYDITILPLSITAFTAQLNLNNTVDLKWETNNEINLSHFEIERSTDAVNFSTAGTMQAKGNTADITGYFMKDNISANPSPVFYYRLHSVAIDGRKEMSATAIIRMNKEAENSISIAAYPNPAYNNLSLMLSSKTHSTCTIHFTNKSGQKILSIPQKIQIGTNQLTIDVSPYAPGIYFLVIEGPEIRFIQKIVKYRF